MRHDLPVPTRAIHLPRITRAILRRRPRELCCTDLAEHLTFECHLHRHPLDCADAVIFRNDEGQIGLPIHDGGSSYIAIRHCPWCGTRLRKQPVEIAPASDRQHVREIICQVDDTGQVHQLLERVSDWVGDVLTEDNRQVIRAGLSKLGSESDTEFTFRIEGWTAVAAIATKTSDGKHIRLQLVGEIDDILAARIETLIDVLG